MGPRYRRMDPAEDCDAPTFNVIVMEYCDRCVCVCACVCVCVVCVCACMCVYVCVCVESRCAQGAALSNARYNTHTHTHTHTHALATSPARGTLSDAVRKQRLFHRTLPGGSIGVDLSSVIDVSVHPRRWGPGTSRGPRGGGQGAKWRRAGA